MSDIGLRTLPLNRAKSNSKPLRELVIRMPNGSLIEQKAHEWAEVNVETEEGSAVLALCFYVNNERILSLPWDPNISVLDRAHVDVEAVLKALTPKRKTRAKKAQ